MPYSDERSALAATGIVSTFKDLWSESWGPRHVGANAYKVDLLAQPVSLALGEGLGSASGYCQIRCKHATQLRVGVDDAHHRIETACDVAIADALGNEIQCAISCGDLLLEALGIGRR
jgi:hypothetical protein